MFCKSDCAPIITDVINITEVIKMKRIILAMIICGLALCLCACGSAVKIDTDDRAIARFAYGDKDISTEFAAEDFKEIAAIFEGKELYSDTPSCSFDENIGIVVGDSRFCIANDTCGIVYVKEKDKYFNLTEEENQKLRALLEEYGFTFPCI